MQPDGLPRADNRPVFQRNVFILAKIYSANGDHKMKMQRTAVFKGIYSGSCLCVNTIRREILEKSEYFLGYRPFALALGQSDARPKWRTIRICRRYQDAISGYRSSTKVFWPNSTDVKRSLPDFRLS